VPILESPDLSSWGNRARRGDMATAKKSTTAASGAAKTASGKQAKARSEGTALGAGTRSAAGSMKPIKEAFGKTALTNHLPEAAGVEPKAVKAVMAALENTILASINKKGARSFVLPGFFKVTAAATPAQKARKGINPFTKQETTFKAKPASVKLKVRTMKKLKDAAA
jgi:nucleoid DNA-binding protein